MKSWQNLYKSVVGLLFLGLSAVSPQVSALSQSQPSSGNMTICPGVDPTKTTAIDLVVLLDDSKSLTSTKNKRVPSDPDGTRFDALKTMFESINSGLENRVPVIPKFFAFGTSVKELNPTSGLDDPSALATDIRELLPIRNQEPGTNFQKALDKATDYLTSRPPSNCKFLVWFTDGVFDLGSNDKEAEKKALGDLKDDTCSSNGWAVALRKAGVNTYVVLLGEIEKLKKDDTDQTFNDSLNLMVELTGDPTPPEGVQSERCEELSHTYDQVGAIYSATDLDQLTAVFEQIGKFIGQNRIVVCPTTSSDQIQSGKMPDVKFIQSFSLISLESSPLPREEQMNVIFESGSSPVTESFTIEKISNTHLEFTPIKGRTLRAGWILGIEKMQDEPLGGLCITAAFQKSPTVRVSQVADGLPIIKEVLANGELPLLLEEDLARVQFVFDGAAISASEIMNKNALGQFDSANLALLSAGLDVNGDLNDPVFNSLFPVYIELKIVEPNFAECLRPFTTSRTPVSGDTPDNRYFETNSCKVSTIGLLEGNDLQVSVENLVSELKMYEGCKDLQTKLQVNDQDIAGNVTTISANQSAQLKLVFKVGEISTECDLMQFEGVEFIVLNSGESEFAKVAIQFNFQQPPDIGSVRWWTIALVLLAALLSLVLFRLISSALAVMPKAHSVYSYDKEIEIGQNAFGQVQVLIDGIELVNYVPSVDDLSKPLSSSSKSQLVLNRVRLERKLGSFFRPFTEPWSESSKSQLASYWQQSPNGGLAIPFRRAIIVSKLENDLMTDGRVRALLTIIVPTTGNWGGVSGVSSLLTGQKTKDVCKDFFEKSRSSGNSLDHSEKKQDGIGGAAFPQGGVKPPGPPPIPKI
jgi:hypothetical protein